jgi:hypothetical protein
MILAPAFKKPGVGDSLPLIHRHILLVFFVDAVNLIDHKFLEEL